MQKCDECTKGAYKTEKKEYILLGEKLGEYNALVCDTCKDTVFSGETLQLVEKKAKEKGVWGIAAKTKVGTSGNALDVKIPKIIADFLNLKKGQNVIVEPLDHKRFKVEIIG